MKRILSFLAAALLLCLLTTAGMAESAMQDSLHAVVNSDRASYAPEDTITLTLQVVNQGETNVSGLTLMYEAPAGYAVAKNNSASKQVSVLAPGGSVTLTTTFCNPNMAVAGNNKLVVICVLLALLALVIGIVLILLKRSSSHGRQMLSLLLIVSLSLTMAGGLSAQALERGFQIPVKVMVDGSAEIFTASVSYEITDASEGIVGDGELALLSSELYVDDRNHLINEPASVLFCAYADPGAQVYLYSAEGENLGLMHDDGRSGDEEAGDGIHSLYKTLQSDKVTIRKFRARSGQQQTELSDVYFFQRPSQEDVFTIGEVQAQLDAIERKYHDGEGYVSPGRVPALLDEVEAYIRTKVADGTILTYTRNDNALIYRFFYAVSVCYAPPLKDVFSGGTASTSLKVCTIQPYASDPEIGFVVMDQTANDIAANMNTISYVRMRDDEQVTLETVRSMESNAIILWEGHGNYESDEIGTLVHTGQPFSYKNWGDVLSLYDDILKQRVVIVNKSSRVAFTSRYVDKYCGDLTNSMLFFNVCYSGENPLLAISLINKGASAVVGYSDAVFCDYALNIMRTTLLKMTEVNAETRMMHTLSEALALAREEHGEADMSGTVPIIFGGEEANRYRLSDRESHFVLPVEQTVKEPAGFTPLYESADLYKIVDNPGGKFILMADLDASICPGLQDVIFTGELDGNGCLIYNLNLHPAYDRNHPTTVSAGLFYGLRDAAVYDLEVEGSIRIATPADAKTNNRYYAYAGGLAYDIEGKTTVTNCVTNVDISFVHDAKTYPILTGTIGGLAARVDANAEGAQISYCRNLGTLGGWGEVAGIVGHITQTEAVSTAPVIYACWNEGEITDGTLSAGIVSTIYTTVPFTVAECANLADITGGSDTGGIVGWTTTEDDPWSYDADGGRSVTIQDCYNSGRIVSLDGPVSYNGGILGHGNATVLRCVNTGRTDGIIGRSARRDAVQNCYYLDNIIFGTIGISEEEWGDYRFNDKTGELTAEQMKNRKNFPKLNFATTWKLDGDMTEPFLRVFSEKTTLEQRFAELYQMFPSGKYWNHVGVNFHEYENNIDVYNAAWTDYPCDTKQIVTGAHFHGECAPYDGHCGCNAYQGTLQCKAFAYYVGYYLMGVDVTSWSTVAAYASSSDLERILQPGDYIRFGDQHSAIVVSVSDTGATLVECNYVKMNEGNNCQIAWTDELSWEKLHGRADTGTIRRYDGQ